MHRRWLVLAIVAFSFLPTIPVHADHGGYAYCTQTWYGKQGGDPRYHSTFSLEASVEFSCDGIVAFARVRTQIARLENGVFRQRGTIGQLDSCTQCGWPFRSPLESEAWFLNFRFGEVSEQWTDWALQSAEPTAKLAVSDHDGIRSDCTGIGTNYVECRSYLERVITGYVADHPQPATPTLSILDVQSR